MTMHRENMNASHHLSPSDHLWRWTGKMMAALQSAYNLKSDLEFNLACHAKSRSETVKYGSAGNCSFSVRPVVSQDRDASASFASREQEPAADLDRSPIGTARRLARERCDQHGQRDRRHAHGGAAHARALGRVSSHTTLRTRFSNSIDIFSSFVAFVGVASCQGSNRAHCRPRGLGERSEKRFRESSAEKIFLCSAASRARFGATTSPVSFSRKRSVGPNGSQTSTLPARFSRPTKRSWPCSTSFDRASALEKYLVPTGLQASGTCGPERAEFGAPQFQSTLVPAMAVDTAAAPDFSDRPVAVVVHLFSSGGGLGIHEPGSQTSGGFLRVTTARSGRARDRAKCPAPARCSYAGRAA